jgi:predicted RNA-binding Zn-ribbon protein involved in translation (DUF1610 family)
MAPLNPFECMASRSLVIDSRVTLPFSHHHQQRMPASCGGVVNPACNSRSVFLPNCSSFFPGICFLFPGWPVSRHENPRKKRKRYQCDDFGFHLEKMRGRA